MPFYHRKYGLSNSAYNVVFCDFCGKEIFVEKYENAPVGTVFATKNDGFVDDSVFCCQGCFKKNYIKKTKEGE